jgi:protein O-GlcNAc transferase
MSDSQEAEAHARRADLYLSRNDLPAALGELEEVLRRRPDWAAAVLNYGSTLLSMGREAEAEQALGRAIVLDAHLIIAYRLLGNLLHRHGRMAELARIYREGRARNPDSLELESFELFLLNFDDTIDDQSVFARHRAYGERLEASVAPRADVRRSRAPRRLRIGYVSSDLKYHPVGLFMLPVLEHHDRSAFDVRCYATNDGADSYTARLSAASHAFRNVSALSDEALAQAIYDDRIDVLVDLAGHSGVCRLGVFARQPAPVQSSWLGYLGTSGLRRIAYRITDRHCDPAGIADEMHTEKLVRLPHSQWCYRPFFEAPLQPRPAFARNGYFSFGSFAQAAKLTSTTRRLWARLLRRLPEARLVMVGVAPGRAQDDLLRDFAAEGVGAQRLRLLPFLPVEDYYVALGEVDVALDPLPYSGGTTTCDALWMGVPVLTTAGSRSASRSASSILRTLGLHDWIASGVEEYVERAVRWPQRTAELAALRAGLRPRMRASPLMDEAGFTRELEQAYLAMWREG